MSDSIILLPYCQAIFVELMRFQVQNDLVQLTSLQRQFKRFIQHFRRQALRHEVAENLVEDAEFALAALIDEVIANSNWTAKEDWQQQPLQTNYCIQQIAGEEFFQRYENLLSQGDLVTAVTDIYYLCLAFGFRGRYALAKTQFDNWVYENLTLKSDDQKTPQLANDLIDGPDKSKQKSWSAYWLITLFSISFIVANIFLSKRQLASREQALLAKMTIELARKKPDA